MLRNKAATSKPEDFTSGRWQPAIGDASITDPSAVQTVILCSGKIRWELVAQRAKRGLEGKVAIVSLERLYPLPTDDLVAELERYPHVTDIRFVQDEPLNQGGWPFMALNLPSALREVAPGRTWELREVTRPASSAPSVGSAKVSEAQQKAMLDAAFA